jgi:hypothetical protein
LGNEIPEGHGAFLLAGEGVAIIVGMTTPVAYGLIGGNDRIKSAAMSGKLMAVSRGTRAVAVPSDAKGLEVYNVNGVRIWKNEHCAGTVTHLPSSIAKGGVCYIKYLK